MGANLYGRGSGRGGQGGIGCGGFGPGHQWVSSTMIKPAPKTELNAPNTTSAEKRINEIRRFISD